MHKNELLRKFSRPVKAIAIYACLITLFFGMLYLEDHILSVKTIIIEGNISSKTQLNGLNTIYNKNLLFVSPKKSEQMLLKENSNLRSVTIKRIFPDKLIISITADEPFAALRSSRGYIFISDEGKIIAKSIGYDYQVPVINYYQKINHDSVNPGNQIDYKEIETSLHFLQKTKEIGLKTNTVDINGFNMIVFNQDSKSIMFTMEKSIEVQDYELEQIIKQFKIEGRNFSRLDLRFDKPVIQF